MPPKPLEPIVGGLTKDRDRLILERRMRHSTFTESEIFSMGAAPDQNYYPPRNLNPSSPSLASAPRGLRGIPSMESTNVTITSLATNATNADAAELGLTVDEYEFYEKTEADHRRMMFMILFFLFFMILYIGFCAYYRKRNKVRRAVEDTTVRTRERQRSANQVRILFRFKISCY